MYAESILCKVGAWKTAARLKNEMKERDREGERRTERERKKGRKGLCFAYK